MPFPSEFRTYQIFLFDCLVSFISCRSHWLSSLSLDILPTRLHQPILHNFTKHTMSILLIYISLFIKILHSLVPNTNPYIKPIRVQFVQLCDMSVLLKKKKSGRQSTQIAEKKIRHTKKQEMIFTISCCTYIVPSLTLILSPRSMTECGVYLLYAPLTFTANSISPNSTGFIFLPCDKPSYSIISGKK